jgi:hypothetical protein
VEGLRDTREVLEVHESAGGRAPVVIVVVVVECLLNEVGSLVDHFFCYLFKASLVFVYNFKNISLLTVFV